MDFNWSKEDPNVKNIQYGYFLDEYVKNWSNQKDPKTLSPYIKDGYRIKEMKCEMEPHFSRVTVTYILEKDSQIIKFNLDIKFLSKTDIHDLLHLDEDDD